MLQPKKDTVKRVAVVREPHEAKVSDIQRNRFALWVIFHSFLSSADFSKIKYFLKNSFRNTISVKQFGSRPGPAKCRA